MLASQLPSVTWKVFWMANQQRKLVVYPALKKLPVRHRFHSNPGTCAFFVAHWLSPMVQHPGQNSWKDSYLFELFPWAVEFQKAQVTGGSRRHDLYIDFNCPGGCHLYRPSASDSKLVKPAGMVLPLFDEIQSNQLSQIEALCQDKFPSKKACLDSSSRHVNRLAAGRMILMSTQY